jgi:hypothetical protein
MQLTLKFIEEDEPPPEAVVWEGLSDEEQLTAVVALAEMMAKALREETDNE